MSNLINNIPEAGSNFDNLLLVVREKTLREFCKSLQGGFFLESPEGITVSEFIQDICLFPPDYTLKHVKTVFINSKPADKLEEIYVSHGMTCALSGAMPGLVGAMMRMGSFYSVFRENITCNSQNSTMSENKIFVKVKLFNRIMYDRGPSLLMKGIIRLREDFIEFFQGEIAVEDVIKLEINKKMLKKNAVKSLPVELIKPFVYFRIETG